MGQPVVLVLVLGTEAVAAGLSAHNLLGSQAAAACLRCFARCGCQWATMFCLCACPSSARQQLLAETRTAGHCRSMKAPAARTLPSRRQTHDLFQVLRNTMKE